MQRRTAALALLAVLVAASGCSTLTGTGPATTTTTAAPPKPAAAIQADAIAATHNVSTYEFDLQGEQRVGDVTITYDSSGVVNRDVQRMRAETTATASTGDQSNTATTVTYIVNDTMYLESQGAWRTRPLDRDVWTQNVLGRQRALLDGANVTYVNTTTVNGVEVYTLAVDPSTESVESYVKQRSDSITSVSVKSVKLTQYVAVDTHRVRKSVVDMTLVANGRTLEQHFVITFTDYGTETNITVPEEAT